MDAALILGIVATGLSALSLGWQAATHVLTGGRIKVKLQVGAMNPRSMITMPAAQLTPEGLRSLADQGYPTPIVAVQVANIGRLPVTVKRWSLQTPQGYSMSPLADSVGPTLPHRLDIGESATWALDLHTVPAFMQAVQETDRNQTINRGLFRRPVPAGVVGVAELADGRSRKSRDRLM